MEINEVVTLLSSANKLQEIGVIGVLMIQCGYLFYVNSKYLKKIEESSNNFAIKLEEIIKNQERYNDRVIDILTETRNHRSV